MRTYYTMMSCLVNCNQRASVRQDYLTCDTLITMAVLKKILTNNHRVYWKKTEFLNIIYFRCFAAPHTGQDAAGEELKLQATVIRKHPAAVADLSLSLSARMCRVYTLQRISPRFLQAYHFQCRKIQGMRNMVHLILQDKYDCLDEF